MQTPATPPAGQAPKATTTGQQATWQMGEPVRGMGATYHYVDGFSTGAQLLHVSEQEAQLIAAAPDLQTALQDLLSAMGSDADDFFPHITKRALAALAKSNGVPA